MSKTFLFQAIQFSQIIQFSTTTPNQSKTWSNSYEGILHIPQSFKTEALSSNSFIYVQDARRGEESYSSAEMQSLYSPDPADLVKASSKSNRAITFSLGKIMNRLIPRSIGWIVSLLFFFMDGFGTKQPTKFDTLLNEDTDTLMARKV